MTRNHSVELEFQHAVKRGGPSLDRSSGFEIDIGIKIVKEEIAEMDYPIFNKEHHEIAVGMPTPQVKQLNCLTNDGHRVLAFKSRIGQEALSGLIAISRTFGGEMMAGALRGNHRGTGHKSRIAVGVIGVVVSVNHRAYRATGESLGPALNVLSLHAKRHGIHHHCPLLSPQDTHIATQTGDHVNVICQFLCVE